MKAEAEEQSTFMETARQDALSALSAVKEQAAEAGVSTNAQIFLREAQSHEELASTWFKWTFGSVIATFVVAVAFLIVAIAYQPPDTAAAIQYVVAKIIVLSTMSFAVIWCARNYKSQKHNETLNKHRANALMTFRAFVVGTSDVRIKDAILLQASQAAFAGRSTGFDNPDKDTQTINPVVEIIGRGISKTPDGSGS